MDCTISFPDMFAMYIANIGYEVRLSLSARISQPFSGVFLSQQISINYFFSAS
jgi:hypothetical protein